MSCNTNTPTTASVPAVDRRTRTLAELSVQQGVRGPQDFDALFGAGSDLWDNEADFEAYLASLSESRATGG
jgi:hypothetical protein